MISNPIQLLAALKAAKPGAILQLEPGVYPAFSITGFKGSVTITSANLSKPAILTGLKVTNSSGLTFSNLEFAFAASAVTTPFGVNVSKSSDVHFRSIHIHGTADSDPSNDIGGISFADCSNVSVEKSELDNLRNGIANGRCSAVKIKGNNFHDIRIDGVDTAAADGIEISHNHFHDFHHLGNASAGGDHSDAIQFFTQNQPRASSNIKVLGNLIVQGIGAVMQGVFIQDEANVGPHRNVEVSGNVIVGGNWNGIAVGHAVPLKVTDNTVAAIPGQVATPWVRITNSPGVVNTGNLFPKVTDAGAALVGAWRSRQ